MQNSKQERRTVRKQSKAQMKHWKNEMHRRKRIMANLREGGWAKMSWCGRAGNDLVSATIPDHVTRAWAKPPVMDWSSWWRKGSPHKRTQHVTTVTETVQVALRLQRQNPSVGVVLLSNLRLTCYQFALMLFSPWFPGSFPSHSDNWGIPKPSILNISSSFWASAIFIAKLPAPGRWNETTETGRKWNAVTGDPWSSYFHMLRKQQTPLENWGLLRMEEPAHLDQKQKNKPNHLHRTIETLRLEQTSKIISSNHQPVSP